MNKKDYSEIAGIINQMLLSTQQKRWYGDDIENNGTKSVVRTEIFTTVNKLASYFEREDKTRVTKDYYNKGKWHKFPNQFNRKRFLKECGVK